MKTETTSTTQTILHGSDPLSRYDQARLNYKLARRELLHYELKKAAFHAKGLARAILGI